MSDGISENPFKINDVKGKKKVSIWSHEQELLLAEWAEKAACFRWLHSKAEHKYESSHYRFSIPIIVLSTLSGTANFGIDSVVPEEDKTMAQMIIGSVNIFAGILGTLQNFFRFAEKMEAHRNAEILWSKFGRSISVELALDPKRRQDADEFLKITRVEYDKLIEQSPSLPPDIIERFKKAFKNNNDIHKPHICNGIDKCKIYKPDKDENVANILANAGNKFKNRSFKNINVQNKGDNFLDIKNNLEKKFNNNLNKNNLNKNNDLNKENDLKKKNIFPKEKKINENEENKILKNKEKKLIEDSIKNKNLLNKEFKITINEENNTIINENNQDENNQDENNQDENNQEENKLDIIIENDEDEIFKEVDNLDKEDDTLLNNL
jgi:hypothetical protein